MKLLTPMCRALPASRIAPAEPPKLVAAPELADLSDEVVDPRSESKELTVDDVRDGIGRGRRERAVRTQAVGCHPEETQPDQCHENRDDPGAGDPRGHRSGENECSRDAPASELRGGIGTGRRRSPDDVPGPGSAAPRLRVP